MRTILLALLLTAIGGIPIKAAAPKHSKPTNSINFGEKQPVGKGRFKEASIYVGWIGYDKSLMREPELDERITTIQQGQFPTNDARVQSHTLDLHILIEADGSVSSCSVAKDASNITVNKHACPHFLKYARFYPALNSDGIPVSVLGRFYVDYDIVLTGEGVDPPPTFALPMPGPPNQRDATPLDQIEPEALGLTPNTLVKLNRDYVSLSLNVNEDGKVSKCSFHSATYDNEIDKSVCQRASAIKFLPTLNAQGYPKPDSYYIYFSVDENGQWGGY